MAFPGGGEAIDPQAAGDIWSELFFLEQSDFLDEALPGYAFDGDLIEIARRYLGVQPVLSSLPNAWFSFPVDSIDAMSAQNWHWDCDRVSWVKVFIYVTDVSKVTGPHSFIEGSHRGLTVRSDKGNGRYSDSFVQEAYPAKQRDFTASRGQILIEDSRGLHRGTPVLEGYRLILQFEYSIDRYGATSDLRPIATRYPDRISRSGGL